MSPKHAIITEARSWLGTRFHHQGRKKGVGCDCIGLLIGVAEALALRSPVTGELLTHYDQVGYSRYPDGTALQHNLSEYLGEIPLSDMAPGDVALFQFESNPQHVGIISGYGEGLGIIHCYAQARKVVEHHFDASWRARLVAAYSLSLPTLQKMCRNGTLQV